MPAELSEKQKKRLVALNDFIKKDKDLVFFNNLLELNDKAEEILAAFSNLESVLKKKLESELVLEIDKAELKGDKGDKGDEGKNYVLTEKDKKEIAQKIQVPIVEKEIVIEKTEVIKEQPVVKEIVKEVAGITKEIADEFKIINEKIQPLKDEISDLKLRYSNNPRVFSGFSKITMDQHFIDDDIPTGTVNGVNKVFVLNYSPNPINSLKVFMNGQKLKKDEDYSLVGRSITFNTAPPAGSIILCDYRK